MELAERLPCSTRATIGTRGPTRGIVRMRSKLLISTAALLAGVALASAQSMQGEQRGGAAQGQQSQSSPKQGQSQDGMQGMQRGQDGPATGQAQPESGAKSKQGQS